MASEIHRFGHAQSPGRLCSVLHSGCSPPFLFLPPPSCCHHHPFLSSPSFVDRSKSLLTLGPSQHLQNLHNEYLKTIHQSLFTKRIIFSFCFAFSTKHQRYETHLSSLSSQDTLLPGPPSSDVLHRQSPLNALCPSSNATISAGHENVGVGRSVSRIQSSFRS